MPQSTPSQPPPGGPMNSEFRDAIHDLAKQARADDDKADEEVRRRLQKKPLSLFIRVGLALIVAQLGVLFYLRYSQPNQGIHRKAEVTEKPAKDCDMVLRRTYWKVVAYLNETGHPPENLEVMLGKYLDKLPSDPVTGKPLLYSKNGEKFDLRCAPVTAK